MAVVREAESRASKRPSLKIKRLQLTVCFHFLTTPPTRYPFNSVYSTISTRMRPPTRSTRSLRPPSNKPSTNARGSRGSGCDTSDPLNLAPSQSNANASMPQPKRPQSQAAVPTTADTTPVVTDTSPRGSDPAPALVLGCFPTLSPLSTTFVFENQKPGIGRQSQTGPAGSNASALGKRPRSRHRITSDKLETLDAFFRRNTHPSRKEKEVICKDLDM
jgi:hypothetical protein